MRRPKSDPARHFWQEAEAVLSFLNEKTGCRYRARQGENEPTSSLKLIECRLRSGATVEQCRQVIAMKVRQWGKDPKMRQFLRPSTLFGPENFEDYYGQLGSQEPLRQMRTG